MVIKMHYSLLACLSSAGGCTCSRSLSVRQKVTFHYSQQNHFHAAHITLMEYLEYTSHKAALYKSIQLVYYFIIHGVTQSCMDSHKNY